MPPWSLQTVTSHDGLFCLNIDLNHFGNLFKNISRASLPSLGQNKVRYVGYVDLLCFFFSELSEKLTIKATRVAQIGWGKVVYDS